MADQLWFQSHRADPRALPLADAHYNRQKIGSPQFVPPGSCFVPLDRGGKCSLGYVMAEDRIREACVGRCVDELHVS